MLAYLNGKMVPLESATIPVWDFGFTMGVAISEQLRTFHGKLPLLEMHLQRLTRGLDLTGIDPGLTQTQIVEIVTDVANQNFAMLPTGGDLGIGLTITAGGQANRAPQNQPLNSATVLVYGLPLNFSDWASQYETGVRLTTVDIREIPDESLPRQMKCRSRMHYFLAEKQASEKSPGSRALLLDIHEHVAEGTTASLLMVRGNTIIAPHRINVLPSVSVRYLETVLCPQLELYFERADFSVEDLKEADELLWLSTSACVLPVAEVDDIAIRNFSQRPIFQKIIAAWSTNFACEIIEQANQQS